MVLNMILNDFNASANDPFRKQENKIISTQYVKSSDNI